MTTLKLGSVEACITAAYGQYLERKTNAQKVATADGDVQVTAEIVGTQYNCGFPGFNMAAADADGLRKWCSTHPGDNWAYGFRGADDKHPDSANVTLINKVKELMFNFHVYLA